LGHHKERNQGLLRHGNSLAGLIKDHDFQEGHKGYIERAMTDNTLFKMRFGHFLACPVLY
jgi:hypothetical protein